MSEDVWVLYDELGDSHFWLRSRYELLEDLVAGLGLPAAPRVLEVGCGSGHLLARIGRRGVAVGVDSDVASLRRCRGRIGRSSVAVSRAESLPFAAGGFDLVMLVDVLEHVEGEGQGLQEVHRVLRPGGLAVVSVPAYPWLFASHDRLFGHLRRYSRPRLRRLLGEAGLEVERATFIQPLFLLPLLLKRRLASGGHDFGRLPGWLNSVLAGILSIDRRLIHWFDIPFGPTLVAVARRPIRA